MRPRALGAVPDLWAATYDIVAQVPSGRVTTYGHVARALGDVAASRFVGLAMSLNDDAVRVPCRRVVQSDGKLGGYSDGGPEKKAALLRAEGIEVVGGKVQGLEQVVFEDFLSDRPLIGLRRRQRALKGHVKIPRSRIAVSHVAGVDVAYDGEHAYAAAAVFDHETGKMVESMSCESDVLFPYVPTYLAFRELPAVSSLVRALPEGTVLMYDGNGLLHPEGMGIATHAGVAFGIPTIGVAKSLLRGTRAAQLSDGRVAITIRGRVVGFEVRSRGAYKPVYVSVGHGISQRQTMDVVRRYMVHRVPEPTRVAHTLAVAARREASHK